MASKYTCTYTRIYFKMKVYFVVVVTNHLENKMINQQGKGARTWWEGI